MYGILIIEKWGICHVSYQGCTAENCLEDTHSLSCWGHLHLFSCKLPCFLLEDIYDINWPLFSQCNRLKKSSWGKPPSFIVPFQPPSHFVVHSEETGEVRSSTYSRSYRRSRRYYRSCVSPKPLWMLQISKLQSKYGTTSWHHDRIINELDHFNRVVFGRRMIPWTQTPSIWHPQHRDRPVALSSAQARSWACQKPRACYKWSQKGPLEMAKKKWVAEIISSL